MQRSRHQLRKLLPRLRRRQPDASQTLDAPNDALWAAAQQLAAAARRLAAATQQLAAATQQLMAAEPARAHARPPRRSRRALAFGSAHYTSRRASYPARHQGGGHGDGELN